MSNPNRRRLIYIELLHICTCRMTSYSLLFVLGICAGFKVQQNAPENWSLAHYLQNERGQAGTKE